SASRSAAVYSGLTGMPSGVVQTSDAGSPFTSLRARSSQSPTVGRSATRRPIACTHASRVRPWGSRGEARRSAGPAQLLGLPGVLESGPSGGDAGTPDATRAFVELPLTPVRGAARTRGDHGLLPLGGGRARLRSLYV